MEVGIGKQAAVKAHLLSRLRAIAAVRAAAAPGGELLPPPCLFGARVGAIVPLSQGLVATTLVHASELSSHLSRAAGIQAAAACALNALLQLDGAVPEGS